MGKASSTKGKNLGHRDFVRCCLALDFMNEPAIKAQVLHDRYYKNLSTESFHKTCKRDREALEQEGFYLTEQKWGSFKVWSLDKNASLADTAKMSKLNRRIAATLLRAAATSPEISNKALLGQSVAKIAQNTCALPVQSFDEELLCNKEILSAVADALHKRSTIQISYQSVADKKPQTRILQPWGMFELGRFMYVVGMRKSEAKEPELRTFNLQRIKHVTILDDEPPYTVRSDFSISDYKFLPFEIGDEDEQELTLYVDRYGVKEFKENVRKRGTLEIQSDESALWKGTMKNTPAAASWALEVGAIPLSPSSLKELWITLNEEALNA